MSKTTVNLSNYATKNNRRKFLKKMVACFGAIELSGCEFKKESGETPAGHFILWQLPPQTHTQMNSYILKTSGGSVIVIDGGCTGDAPYIRGFLGALGNHVHAWFISHSHFDHVDALIDILKIMSVIFCKIGKSKKVSRYYHL